MLSISKLLYIVLDQGTNFGMKNHSASLKPTMGMDSLAHIFPRAPYVGQPISLES